MRIGGRKSRARQRIEPEFELLDTGIFDEDRYFDVFVEYAKSRPDDILMLVTVHNRGPETATIHVLPQIWFRNTWSWECNSAHKPKLAPMKPMVAFAPEHRNAWAIIDLHCDGPPTTFFLRK